jgi:4-amino-4-deoxy-L-arabinose transferase-like glycosyltransferase
MKNLLRRVFTSLTVIVVVALGARLGFAWNQEQKIPRQVLATLPFEQETGSIAHSLATGKGFGNPFLRDTGPTAWLTPIYPLLVAATFRLFGIFTIGSFFFLVVLNAIFSAAVCVPLYFIGKRLAGVGVGSAAGWLWALFPSAVMMPFEWIWDTSLTALLVVVLLWATIKLAESPLWRNWCAYGLLWGFTLMTNPSVASVLPFLLGWAAYRAWKRGPDSLSSSFSKAALTLATAVLCCIPWTVRNYVVFHRFVPLRSNFPLELYIGNNENYGDKHPRWPPPITKERETVRYFHMGETAFMDEEMRKAKSFILSHPRVEMELFGYRFADFWAGVANPAHTFLTADSLLVQSLILCGALSGTAALCGIVVLFWRRSPLAIPVSVVPIVFPVLYYLTHTSVRYRHPIDPIVLLLTAVAGGALVQRISSFLQARVDKRRDELTPVPADRS